MIKRMVGYISNAKPVEKCVSQEKIVSYEVNYGQSVNNHSTGDCVTLLGAFDAQKRPFPEKPFF